MNWSIIFIVAIILLISARIVMMIAVGIDAASLEIKKKNAWMVLTFFIPETAIVYAISRNKLERISPKFCLDCESVIDSSAKICPNCNSANVVSMVRMEQKKKSKSALILGIVACFMIILSIFAGTVGITALVVDKATELYKNEQKQEEQLPDEQNPFNYYNQDDLEDFYEDFFENPNEFFNQYGY